MRGPYYHGSRKQTMLDDRLVRLWVRRQGRDETRYSLYVGICTHIECVRSAPVDGHPDLRRPAERFVYQLTPTLSPTPIPPCTTAFRTAWDNANTTLAAISPWPSCAPALSTVVREHRIHTRGTKTNGGPVYRGSLAWRVGSSALVGSGRSPGGVAGVLVGRS